MANENAVLTDTCEEVKEQKNVEFDYDELIEKLDSQLEEELAQLDFLKEEQEKIANPDNLGEVIKGVVWEQFINQIAVVAGEDFIVENNGLTLDLSEVAHIQTTENFADGKIATHNYKSKEQLEQNYERYTNTPHKEFRDEYVDPGMNATLKRAGTLKKQGIDTVTDIYTGQQIPTETKLENGKNNPKAAQREHVKASAEVYENASLQMANNNEELAGIINDPNNLQGYTTAERNNRKSDKSSEEMDAKDKTKHWEKANEKAEEFIKQKENEGEERLKQEGSKTRKEEASRIAGTALRAFLMQLFVELVRELISKLVKWLKQEKKNLETLLESIKNAILAFVGRIEKHLLNAGNSVVTAVATAIVGPVVDTIKKAWVLLKQGWKSIKEAVDYLRNPKNKGKSVGLLILEVGKIITVGVTGAGAILLGEAIEALLKPLIPIEIPLIGSLASILGIFFGAVIAGIIGAIAINIIQKKIEKVQKSANMEEQIDKSNEVINLQHQLRNLEIEKFGEEKDAKLLNIESNHMKAEKAIRTSCITIKDNCKIDTSIDDTIKENSEQFDELLGED